MKNILYVIAALLVIIWAITLLMFNVGVMVHFIIVLALALVVINKVNNKKVHESLSLSERFTNLKN